MSQESIEKSLAKQRVETCPIKPCRGADDNETQLRCIRTDRLLCMHCAVQTPVGYIGKEVAREHEDKFFRGTTTDYAIVFVICTLGSTIANALTLAIGGFFLVAFFIGIIGGGATGQLARRLTARRLGRQSALVAVAGVALGLLAGPTVWLLLRTGVLIFEPAIVFRLGTLICSGVMVSTIYGLFSTRIKI